MKSKKDVRESWYIFTIVMLSILLGLSLYLFLQNPFVTNKPRQSGLIQLGTPINIKVDAVGASAKTVFFEGSILPNSVVQQDVKITLNPAQENAALRAKVFMFDEFVKLIPLEITTTSNWEKGGDGYYYCQEVLSANLVLDFAKELQIPSSEKGLNSANTYSIIYIIETLPVGSNFEEIWKIN